MRIVIISNVTNQIGLQRDAELLRDWLSARSHSVTLQQYNQPPASGPFDLAIFIETMEEHLVSMASRCWYIANPEWLKPEMIRPIQRHCERVIAKTREAERVLREHFSSVVYTGFLCADKRNTATPRVPEALHIGGNSGFRGTNAVVSAWREYRYWDNFPLPPLTVISNSKTVEPFSDVPGITFIKRATDEQVTELQNSCLYHIQPSATEGYGQAIHESQSVGAILLTTQAAPMTELCAPFEIPSATTRRVQLATANDVSPAAIREAIPRMLALPNYEIAAMQLDARMRFEAGNAEFDERFGILLDSIALPPAMFGSDPLEVGPYGPFVALHAPVITPKPLRIAMLGNFHPPHSTENDLAWTLRDMGHTVIQFQENEDTTEEILRGSVGCKLFLYIHTHGYTTPGRMLIRDLISELRSNGIKTCGFHLDRYIGLNIGDRRDELIGKHGFWSCDRIFTADGGNQEIFRARGVEHSWLPPGVVKREVYRAKPDDSLRIDIGFCGAVGYHSEYPFRSQMIEALQANYGDRFKVFTGFRGERLNTLYASIKICVGDCCFAGQPRYWSDRLSECAGRGGFLLHPQIEGMCIPTATYTPQNIHDLFDKIDYYLEHDEERELIRDAAHRHTNDHDTYHNRMAQLLRRMNV